MDKEKEKEGKMQFALYNMAIISLVVLVYIYHGFTERYSNRSTNKIYKSKYMEMLFFLPEILPFTSFVLVELLLCWLIYQAYGPIAMIIFIILQPAVVYDFL